MFRRVAFSKESSFKVASTWVNAKGLLSPVNINPGRERIKRDDALNSKGDNYADEHGRQTYSAQLSYYLTANSYADLKSLFTAALGAENSATTLTFSSTATNLGVNISAGGPAALIRSTGNDGKTYFVGVDTSAANLLTYFPSLPVGVTTTAISNLSALSGGVFDFANVGSAADTFSIESDWATKPTQYEQEVILAKGCALTSCKLAYEKDKLLSFGFTFGMGAEYTETAGPAVNVADPGVWTVPYLGWAGDWILAAPAQGTGAGYLVNNVAGYSAGTTTIAMDTGTGTIKAGDSFTIAGHTGDLVATQDATSTSLTFQPPLNGSIADNAAITLIGTPTWSTTKTALKKLDIEMARELNTESGSNGLDGGSTITSTLPGSDIKGYTTGGGPTADVVVMIPWDPRWLPRFRAKIPTKLFGVMYPGAPNSAPIPVNRAILYIRRLMPVGRPSMVVDGGVKCMQLQFMIERDLTANGIPERIHFGLSNA